MNSVLEVSKQERKELKIKNRNEMERRKKNEK